MADEFNKFKLQVQKDFKKEYSNESSDESNENQTPSISSFTDIEFDDI